MSKKLDVNYEGEFSYHIYIEKTFEELRNAVSGLQVSDRRALIVTDKNVAPLYLDKIKDILSECFCFVDEIILTPGEENKNTDSIAHIYEKAIQDDFDRNDFMVALGGGVVGDMTGFAAATYMRGIRFIHIPTTLLSQVDSSIGGKTGVDFRAYKNMVGAFHMPSLVYSAVSTLESLDAVQYASGMGEVIKHSLIKDKDYFRFLTDNLEGLRNRDMDVLMETVYQSNVIKKEVVEKDPKEKGERQLLNFGHTLGHAIEKCSDFSYSHGQCVAFGCLAAMHISDVTTGEENKAVCDLMKAVGLQTVLKPMDHQAILAATRKDKKMDKGRVRFILIHSLGNAYIDNNVSDESMLDALGYISK